MHRRNAVKEELKRLDLHFVIADTGIVDVMENLTDDQYEHIRRNLAKTGLVTMEQKQAALIEKTESLVINMVHNMDHLSGTNYADYISEGLHFSYAYLDNLFSQGRGISLENFIIFHKTERVKELLIYKGLSYKDIALKMHFGTIANLSSQYKRVTGLSLSHFKRLNAKRRILAEEVRDLLQM